MEAEVDVSDEEDEDDDIIPLPLVGGDLSSAKTASLDKMVGLVAVLVEKSRGEDNLIHLAQVHSQWRGSQHFFTISGLGSDLYLV